MLREKRGAVTCNEERKAEMRTRISEIEKVLGGRDGLLGEFDGELFGALVDRVEIEEGGEIEFLIG